MFFEFGIKDIIDIVSVALMLFYIYRLMRESRSLNVFYGILVFVLVWLFVSQVLEMKLRQYPRQARLGGCHRPYRPLSGGNPPFPL